MIPRLIPALLLGLGVSAGLFWLMYAMLQQHYEHTDRDPLTQVDFVRLKREETPPDTLTRELPPPEPETSMPPTSTAIAAPDPSQPSAAAAPAFDMPKLALPVGGGGIAAPVTGLSDWSSLNLPAPDTAPSEGLPGGQTSALGAILRIPPTYPMEARRQKLEGWVRMEFTVQEDGTVADVKVKESKPSSIFDQAAVNAIRQWKFRPAMQDGKPVRKRAAQTLKFALDK